MTSKNIAIVTKSEGLADAVKMILAPRNPGATFSVVTKISDAPAGSEIANLGIPAFIPSGASLTVHSLNTRRCEVDADRQAQWKMLRDTDATCEEVLAELNGSEKYTILPERAVAALKMGMADHRVSIAEASCAIAEARSDEEKAAAQAVKATAYEKAFKYLLGALPI